MDSYVAIIFNSDEKAFDGLDALWKLNRTGDITVHGAAVIHRPTTGKATVAMKRTAPGLRTALGAALGGLLGMLAGPAGAAAGAYAGAVAGLGGDGIKGGEHSEAADEVEAALRPGQAAVVAEVSEDQTSLLDPTMRALGGDLHRRGKGELRHAFFDFEPDVPQQGYFADPSA
ncbi:MAG: DUF1269 domain-containing protein [Candidatus Eremiobacteraeota bacterium]|nr:DUF1269 domain-containing protein [Candidatus Eremiobacteraeota bacterium]